MTHRTGLHWWMSPSWWWRWCRMHCTRQRMCHHSRSPLHTRCRHCSQGCRSQLRRGCSQWRQWRLQWRCGCRRIDHMRCCCPRPHMCLRGECGDGMDGMQQNVQRQSGVNTSPSVSAIACKQLHTHINCLTHPARRWYTSQSPHQGCRSRPHTHTGSWMKHQHRQLWHRCHTRRRHLQPRQHRNAP